MTRPYVNERYFGRIVQGKKTIIIGDVNSGKTTMSRKILETWAASLPGDRIAVIDMAPGISGGFPMTETIANRSNDLKTISFSEISRTGKKPVQPLAKGGGELKGIGGRLIPPKNTGVLYLADLIVPPRMTAASEDEALRLAERNRARIDALFREFKNNGREILFINDISLYLHAGTAGDLKAWLEDVPTIVANGYWGESLGSGALSRRERERMLSIQEYFDVVIKLDAVDEAI